MIHTWQLKLSGWTINVSAVQCLVLRTLDAIAAIGGIEAPSGHWCMYSIRIVLRGFLDAFDNKGGLWEWTGVQFREDEKEKILNNTTDDYFSTGPANAS